MELNIPVINKIREKNQKRFPKVLFIIFGILFIFLVAFSFYRFWNMPQKPNLDFSRHTQGVELSTNKNIQKSVSKNDECIVTDSIEYFYYTNPTPQEQTNNKFGLYIYAESSRFFELADELVNSNGGDWGYVLVPYNIRDRDTEKWGRAFTTMAEKHLIPVIQLNDIDLDSYERDTINAAKFLDSFIWPTKERYISVYNEPNDNKFWFNDANPQQYAQILDYTIDTFKEVNSDFYMLNGALNASAPSGGGYIDAPTFLYLMNQEVPGIFGKLDGWASHSYPQPNFSGSPYAQGWWSIQAYASELEYLQNTLGVQKELPVFITETGWAHAEGEIYNPTFLPVSQVSENFIIAYQEIWLPDDRVRAVMPFTIIYDPPFDHFSWVNPDLVPYAHFDAVKELPKVAGNPAHLVKARTEPTSCK